MVWPWNKDLPYYMMWQYVEVNETIDYSGKLVMLSNSQIDEPEYDTLRNELNKHVVIVNKNKKQNICAVL